MGYDLYFLLTMAVLGVVDCQLERRTGRGIIARVQDWLEARRDT